MKDKFSLSLACPRCFGALDYDQQQQTLICPKDQLLFSIIDDIPVLIEEEAKKCQLAESKDNV